jgi:hypothetical protein
MQFKSGATAGTVAVVEFVAVKASHLNSFQHPKISDAESKGLPRGAPGASYEITYGLPTILESGLHQNPEIRSILKWPRAHFTSCTTSSNEYDKMTRHFTAIVCTAFCRLRMVTHPSILLMITAEQSSLRGGENNEKHVHLSINVGRSCRKHVRQGSRASAFGGNCVSTRTSWRLITNPREMASAPGKRRSVLA